MLLTRDFTADQFSRALESWHWLDLGGKEPLFASLFGDIFFSAEDGFWWLDTLEGSLTRPWRSADELTADLDTAEGQDKYLLGALAHAAADSGLVLTEQQIYVFDESPILGGPIAVEKLSVVNFVVGVNIAGQLHDQLRGLPPGTAITDISVTY
jgi:hypothetical protein